MDYLTRHLIPGVDSEGRVFFKVDHDGEVLSFSEMHSKHGFALVSIVPINAEEENWKGVAVFVRITQPNSLFA